MPREIISMPPRIIEFLLETSSPAIISQFSFNWQKIEEERRWKHWNGWKSVNKDEHCGWIHSEWFTLDVQQKWSSVNPTLFTYSIDLQPFVGLGWLHCLSPSYTSHHDHCSFRGPSVAFLCCLSILFVVFQTSFTRLSSGCLWIWPVHRHRPDLISCTMLRNCFLVPHSSWSYILVWCCLTIYIFLKVLCSSLVGFFTTVIT